MQNRPISLHIYPERLVIVMLKACLRHDAEGHVVCEHQRIIERSHRLPGRVIHDWRHYLAPRRRQRGSDRWRRRWQLLGPMADNGSIQRKPGALRYGAPFVEMPEAFRQLQDHMLRKPGGDREMVEILSLVLHNVMPEACFSV